MQKLFLELVDTDYDTISGKYTIDVSYQDIRNPKEITINSITVKLPEDSDYLLVYSDSLTQINKQHSASTNTEFGDAVYALQPEHRIVRSITTSTTTGGTTASDADIIALGSDVKLWMPMDETTLLDSSYGNTPNIGDNVRYIYQKSPPADSTMVFNGYQDFQVSSFGQGRGISSQASWQYAIDSSTPNAWGVEECSIVFSMKMPLNLAATHKIFDFHTFKFELRNPGTLYSRDWGNMVSTGLTMIPGKDYMFTIRRHYDSSVSGYVCSNWVENLETGAVAQGNDTPLGADVTTPGNTWRMSDASQHFLDKTGIVGPILGVLNTTTSRVSIMQNWVRTQYDTNPVSTTTVSTSNTYQLFSKQQKTIECKQHSHALRKIDLQFRNAGVVVKPLSGLIEINIS